MASSINTSGERPDKSFSVENSDVSPRLPRFDVIREEEDEESGVNRPMLT